MIQNITLMEEPDKRWWCLCLNGNLDFKVNDIRHHIDEIIFPYLCVVIRWNWFVPWKINIFILRLCLDQIPIKLNFSKKGIEIHIIMCPICDGYIENLEHLFFRCEVAAWTWSSIFGWLDLQLPMWHSLLDIFW